MVTYTVLFFPFSFRNLYYSLKGDNASDEEDSVRDISGDLTSALVYLSPLIDSSIYIFIRRDKRTTQWKYFPAAKSLSRSSESFRTGEEMLPQTEMAL